VRRCAECGVDIEGDWARCPLCASPVAGEVVRDPLPTVRLTFSRRRVLKVLFLTSIAVISASFVAQLPFNRGLDELGVLRSVWLGVSTMWLVVLMGLRKRHNVAKGTVYLVALTGLACVYWDYLTGWHGWSLTYAVPIVCACSVVAVLITVRVMRIEIGDHILYSGLTALLGLAPIVFLAFGWVTNPVPSAICGSLSIFALVGLQIVSGPEVRHELAKRMRL
jgi:hypothetical protein